MNLETILAAYSGAKQTLQINQWIEEGADASLYLQGLSGSAEAFVAAAVFNTQKRNHLFILNDKEEAAYFQNNLRSILDKKDMLFFPDSYKRPQTYDELNKTNVLMRTEIVNKFANFNKKNEIAVTYPEALFEKVIGADKLKDNTLFIKIGEKLDIDNAIDFLIEFNFDRVDFVYEPGQFSIRGGIIDIFSFGNELPFRIELFDDEIESIRLFDPSSQLSTQKIASVSIVPNSQTHFDASDQQSLFQILAQDTVVWIKDKAYILELLDKCMQRAKRAKENISVETAEENHPLLKASAEEIFISPNQFLNEIKNYKTIEFGTKAYTNKTAAIYFKTSPQPSFNKNFNLLIETLKDNTTKGFTNYIFSDNAKQIERFYAIFEDLKADVKFHAIYHAIHQGFVDDDLKIVCYTDHQIFNRYHKYSLKQGFSKDSQLLLKTLKELKPGDFVTHIDHGVGVFSGLEKIEVGGQQQEAVRLIYAGNDILYVGIQSLHKIAKYTGKEGHEPRVNKLGSEAWDNLKKKTKKRIKELAFDLIKLYAKRKSQQGFKFSKDSFLQNELEASFMYEDTPDQAKATEDVKKDMEKMQPMDRLVCGDVGFGKTEVAIRAAFKAACDNKQVAVMVPTTILAFQHYKTFKERLADFPIEIDFINRFKTAKQKKETLKKVEDGTVSILIGTHAIVGKSVKFKDLGLLIIDEEQKFGVQTKDMLKELKVSIDCLTLTATPIPRTLQFSMMGSRDLSIINTPPPNRQPVNTEVHTLDPDIIKEAIEFEVYRGGQVFFVHNRVKDLMDIKNMLHKIVPDIAIGMAHGQLEGDKLEEVLLQFMDREFDVLLSTNIIEAGIDIPNANTIIINNAHQFGLSDLHQLRGRVGRSNKQAFCYLFAPPKSTLTQEAKQRLQTIEEFAELGSGFNIAMRDLDIRGAGNILGGEQSGFIADIGYDMYHKILDETVRELRQTEFKDLYQEQIKGNNDFVKDCTIESDMEMLIPDSYVKNSAERMILYKQLNDIANEEELADFETQLIDRFGKTPTQVNELFNGVRLKWMATKLGIEQMIIKNKHMRCYFVSNQQSVFYSSAVFTKILGYVQSHKQGFYLRETEKYLILNIEKISNMQMAKSQLTALYDAVFKETV